MAREQADYDEAQAALQREAGVLVIDVKKAELFAQKVLKQHSVRMKVALSELVVQTAEDLRSPEVKPKDRAMALAALKSVSNQLYGWSHEPEIQSMKLARKGGDDVPTGAVNLALINTSPEELARLAEAKSDHSDDHSGDHFADHFAGHFDQFSDRDGDYSGDHSSGRNVPSAKECNGKEMGPSLGAPEQPPAATHGRPIPKKEAPTPLLESQSAQVATAGHPSVSHPAPLSQTPFGQTPQERHRHQLEELNRLQAEWRGWR